MAELQRKRRRERLLVSERTREEHVTNNHHSCSALAGFAVHHDYISVVFLQERVHPKTNFPKQVERSSMVVGEACFNYPPVERTGVVVSLNRDVVQSKQNKWVSQKTLTSDKL